MRYFGLISASFYDQTIELFYFLSSGGQPSLPVEEEEPIEMETSESAMYPLGIDSAASSDSKFSPGNIESSSKAGPSNTQEVDSAMTQSLETIKSDEFMKSSDEVKSDELTKSPDSLPNGQIISILIEKRLLNRI